jgi:hypothetical protein
MKTEDFVPIMKLGFIPLDEDSDMMNPAVLVSNVMRDFKFNPTVAAGLLTSVIECIVDQIPESEQIGFEKETLKKFKKIVNMRHEHVNKFDLPDEDE